MLACHWLGQILARRSPKFWRGRRLNKCHMPHSKVGGNAARREMAPQRRLKIRREGLGKRIADILKDKKVFWRKGLPGLPSLDVGNWRVARAGAQQSNRHQNTVSRSQTHTPAQPAMVAGV